jgi:large subunit ribosomal protein L15
MAYQINPTDGSRGRRKRVGRGTGSGLGKTAGKGHKGQKARSGHSRRAWFEGGQMPLQRRIPKRGFTPLFKQRFQVVNLNDLEHLEAVEVDARVLKQAGLIRDVDGPVKILGQGSLTRPLQIKAEAFSATARQAVEAAGGNCLVTTPVATRKPGKFRPRAER